MYSPATSAPALPAHAIDGIRAVTLTTKDNLALLAWYIPPQDNKPVLVFFHGNAGHLGYRAGKAQTLQRAAGTGMLMLSYRGYAGNPGKPTEQGFYKDGRAAMHFLQDELHIPPEKIFIYGESIGTGVAVQMATEFKAAGLILEAPFTGAASVAKSIYFMIPIDLLLKDRYDNIDKIGHLDMPLLIIHGTDDNIVPQTEGGRLYNAAPQPKAFASIDGGGHNNLWDFTQTPAVITAFTEENTALQNNNLPEEVTE
ncbi:MAG: alpha/beta hydrolase [Proteobacteria bacterium]|nr:alpha/beta hydrolase [Pseudomonadota bacterium]|tara:strand:- start:1433 stop:2197 length:765 start_codon:yes stop_codon:yes gene_type:complete